MNESLNGVPLVNVVPVAGSTMLTLAEVVVRVDVGSVSLPAQPPVNRERTQSRPTKRLIMIGLVWRMEGPRVTLGTERAAEESDAPSGTCVGDAVTRSWIDPGGD